MFINLNLIAQIQIRDTLLFISQQDSLRQISNLSKADSLHQAITPLDMYYKRYFDYSNVSVIDSVLSVSVPFGFPLTYTNGMTFIVEVPQLTDSVNVPRYIQFSSLSVVPIKIITNILHRKMIQSKRILLLIFDGFNFVLVNSDLDKCPVSYKKVNDNYCITINRRAQATFWNANKKCIDEGAHLCYFEEWYFACLNNSGISKLPLNWEWINTNSNHNIHALKMGNSSSCTTTDSETTAPTGLSLYYRCCYSLR
jgi:hypothetical protein